MTWTTSTYRAVIRTSQKIVGGIREGNTVVNKHCDFTLDFTISNEAEL
jgi:hypothetical protein